MIIGKSIEDGKDIELDLQRILDGRLLLQANSGGGKSYALRKLLEITHGKAQQIILDPEGEFATLREKFDYILIGKDGDIPINVQSSGLLARRLLELGTSAIIDLYELKHNERKRFVKLFLDSLVNAPKELWHPCVVVVDEAHVFAPESSHGQAESLDAVKDLATRGRKRGFALVAATQRLSKLSKDVVAELNTKLIGRSSLDVDMKRAAYELGFTSKEDIFKLRKLDKGEFFAFGPALTSEVTKIKIDKCTTTHPEAGQSYKELKTASSKKIQQVLGRLSDLPKEAEEELRTKDDFKRKIMELKRELSSKRPVVNEKEIEMAEKRGFSYAENQYKPIVRNLESQLSKTSSKINQINKITGTDMLLPPQPTSQLQPKQRIPDVPPYVPPTKSTKVSIIDRGKLEEAMVGKKLRHGAMKILKVVAMFHPTEPTKQQIGTQAGFSIKGGTFTTYLSELKREDWITVNGNVVGITDEGLKNAGIVDSLPTDPDEILRMWRGRFRQGASAMLKEIFNDREITKDELSTRDGVPSTVGGGTFTTYLSELKRNGLIEVNGDIVKISESFFP